MDKETLEKYKNEMLKMYRSQKVQPPAIRPTVAEVNPKATETTETPTGGLLAVVTTVRNLYPVSNAKVTIFTGDYDNKNVIDSAFTDQSGRTKVFILPTPQKALSLDKENKLIPYAVYNMLVEADGYIDNIHLNIPVFSGVTSIQTSNMLLKETAGEGMEMQIFDEAEKYDL